jgi:DNA-binding PadR family transcriptional regulator
MSLKHAMLGFLNIQSMNGYQLKKHFDESVKHFWNASISQIYPTLNEMLESGLISIENYGDGTARPSKTYAITDKGREELHNWLSVPSGEEPFRSEMLLKLYFSSQLDTDMLISHFSQLKKSTQENLEFYASKLQHLDTCHTDESSLKKDAVYWRMTARYGILKNLAQINWCDECIDILEQDREEKQENTGLQK